jgi:hypothetical protein
MMDLRISAFGLMGASNFRGTKLLLKIPEPKTTTDFTTRSPYCDAQPYCQCLVLNG